MSDTINYVKELNQINKPVGIDSGRLTFITWCIFLMTIKTCVIDYEIQKFMLQNSIKQIEMQEQNNHLIRQKLAADSTFFAKFFKEKMK